MIVSSRFLYLGAACALAALIIACDKNQAAPSSNPAPSPAPAPAPAPAPSPSPSPSPSVFSISGTVAETAPTTDRFIGSVTVSTGSASATTDGNGRFTLTGLAAGAYTLRASKDGYSEQVISFTLPADATTTLRFNLEPKADTVTNERSGTLGQDNSVCSGSSYPCARIDWASHHEGDVEATVLWSSSDADIFLELRCNGEVLATQTDFAGQQARSGEVYLTKELTGTSRKGQICEVRAVHKSGPEQKYTLVVSHKN